MTIRQRCAGLATVAAAAALAVLARAGHAQTPDEIASYPNRPVKLVVGFAPGGANDIVSRIVGQKLSERLGQPVVVENKTGAGGFIAGEYVARAPRDGYTLFTATSGMFVIAPAIYSKLPYDPINSFAPIGVVAVYPMSLVVDASRNINSVNELVTYIKANPAKANYGSVSALFQLATELFMSKTGTRLEHIPFKSSLETTASMLNGQVLMTMSDPAPVLPHIKSGKLKLLGVAGAKRAEQFPEAPTLKELGIDMEVEVFAGLVTTAGTPPAIVKRLETELAAIRQMPDAVERLKGVGMPVAGGTAQEFADLIARQIPMWTAIAKAANIKMD